VQLDKRLGSEEDWAVVASLALVILCVGAALLNGQRVAAALLRAGAVSRQCRVLQQHASAGGSSSAAGAARAAAATEFVSRYLRDTGGAGGAASDWLERGSFRRSFHFVTARPVLDVAAAIALVVYSTSVCLTVSGTKGDAISTASVANVMGACGLFLQWASSTRFIEDRQHFQVMVATLEAAAGNALRLLATSAPLFVGFTLAGTLLFSEYTQNFSSFGTSAVTLYAVTFGDEVNETFRQIYPTYPILSRVYLFSFSFVFYFIVVNLFIFM